MDTATSFRTLDDVSAWLDRVDNASSVRGGSGFAPGTALAHCAQSLEMQRTGYPSMKPTIIRRTVGVIVRNRFVAKGEMSHGTDTPIPGAPDLGEVSLEDGVAALRTAIVEFQNHRGAISEHFVFGDVNKVTAELLQAFHIANHASEFVITE